MEYRFPLYDYKLVPYITTLGFKYELSFSFMLPQYAPGLNGINVIKLNENDLYSDYFYRYSRYIVISSERKWNDNQHVFTPFSLVSIREGGYTVISTSIVCSLQIYDDEIELINSLFFKEQDEKLKLVLQDLIENIFYRYNIANNGNVFINSSSFLVDRICASLFRNINESKFLISQYVVTNFQSASKENFDERHLEDSKLNCDVEAWLYFKNKSIYEYNIGLYMDSIISAEISIESFLYYLLRKHFNNDDESINKFTMNMKDNNEKQSAVIALLKKIVDNKICFFNKSKTKLANYISSISLPRNDIMHGRTALNKINKEKARKANDGLISFYNSTNISNNSYDLNIEVPSIECFDEVVREKITKENYNSQVKKIEELYNKYENGVILLKLLTCYYYMGDRKQIRILIDDYLKYNDGNDLLVAFATYLINNNDIDYAMDMMCITLDNDKDHRCFSLIALIDFKLMKNVSSFDVNNIKEYIGFAKIRNIKYLVPYIIDYKLLIRTGDYTKAIEILDSIIKFYPNIYSFSYDCIYCAYRLNDKKMVKKYLNIFKDAFMKNHYKALKVDFYQESYDLNQIRNNLKAIVTKLSIDYELSFLDDVSDLKNTKNIYELWPWFYNKENNGFINNIPFDYIRIGNSSNFVIKNGIVI